MLFFPFLLFFSINCQFEDFEDDFEMFEGLEVRVFYLGNFIEIFVKIELHFLSKMDTNQIG